MKIKDDNYQTLLYKIKFPMSIIEREFEYMSFYDLVVTQNLSEEFIEKFLDKFSIQLICQHQNLSEDFIKRYKNKVVWHAVSYKYSFSNDFIEEFKDYIHWPAYSSKLDFENIVKYKDKIYFNRLNYLLINENFVINNIKENWEYDRLIKEVSFSIDFLDKYIDLFKFKDILEYQYVDSNFVKKHILKIYKCYKDNKLNLFHFYNKLDLNCSNIENFILDHWNILESWEHIYTIKFSEQFIKNHINDDNEIFFLAYQDEFDYRNINFKKYKMLNYNTIINSLNKKTYNLKYKISDSFLKYIKIEGII